MSCHQLTLNQNTFKRLILYKFNYVFHIIPSQTRIKQLIIHSIKSNCTVHKYKKKLIMILGNQIH